MLQLKPEHLSGVALFEHQFAFCKGEIAARDHKLSDHLNVEVQCRHQEDLRAPDVASRIQHNIMQEIGAFGNNKRLAQRKLNALGYAKPHICFINNPSWIERLRSRLDLEKFLDAAKKIKDDKAVKNKLEEEGEHAKLMPEDVQVYST